MKNKTISEIVHCLSCGSSSLVLAKEGEQLQCESCGKTYPIKKGVPVFLSETDTEKAVETDLHKTHDSVFNYIDHYQKDGVENDYFKDRDAGTEHLDKRVHQTIFSQIKHKSGRVLDVGCGRAWVAREMCPKSYEVVSMDISLENTSVALERYPFGNHSAVVADVFNLPFNENTFDVIIASEIIEHVVDPVKFVENLIRVLKPGGTLIITTPYKEKLTYSLCVHCNKLTPLHAHIHSFDENILTSLYQGKDLAACNYLTFANQIPIHLRMHVLFRHFSFWCWRMADKFFNFIYNKPIRILVKWQKSEA